MVRVKHVLVEGTEVSNDEFVESHETNRSLLNANRHQKVAETNIFDSVHHCRAYGVGHFKHYFVADDCFDTVNQERWVERDSELLTLIIAVDIVFNVTGVDALGADF